MRPAPQATVPCATELHVAAKGDFKCVPKTTSGDSLVKQMVDNIDKGGMATSKSTRRAGCWTSWCVKAPPF